MSQCLQHQRGQIRVLAPKPQQDLPGAAQLHHFREDQMHSLLQTPVGSISTLSLGVHRKPIGNRNWSSRRRAFWRIASNDRCRSKFSSNSLILLGDSGTSRAIDQSSRRSGIELAAQ
jgi:hypothetical protein